MSELTRIALQQIVGSKRKALQQEQDAKLQTSQKQFQERLDKVLTEYQQQLLGLSLHGYYASFEFEGMTYQLFPYKEVWKIILMDYSGDTAREREVLQANPDNLWDRLVYVLAMQGVA